MDVVLGELVKVLGLRGELKLRTSADFWSAALESAHLVAVHGDERRQVRVASARPHGAGAQALHFEGVDERVTAERLVGATLVLAAEDVDVPLPERLLDVQLCGMEVRLPGEGVLGSIVDVLHLPAHDVLVVHDGARDVLVPAVPPFVKSVDAERRVVHIEPIPGLLEL